MEYGGEKWADIVHGLRELKKVLTSKSFDGIISAIDHLNDLEHNNNLYLDDWTSFRVEDALDYKKYATEQELMDQCSDFVRGVGRSMMGVARWHDSHPDD